jgi:Spy/CpxP family protein refolding chaperone
MARQIVWVLALVLTCVPPSAAASFPDDRQGRTEKPQGTGKEKTPPAAAVSVAPGDRERWKWWLYDRAELSITDKQSAEINQIFEATIPKLRESRQELDRAEEELSRTIKEYKADLATISILVDRVESARSQHAKMRVLMLYRIDQLLTPEQRTKVDALRARQERERRERDKERRRP